jgi:hypothetical protein
MSCELPVSEPSGLFSYPQFSVANRYIVGVGLCPFLDWMLQLAMKLDAVAGWAAGTALI